MKISPADRYFLRLCEAQKVESHDPHRQVGVVIVSASGRVLATGTNRPPAAMKLHFSDSQKALSDDPAWKYYMLEHAERNAINSGYENGCSMVGATMYGSLFPCADCAPAVVTAGIARLVVPHPDSNYYRDEKWIEHYKYSSIILEKSGVTVDFVSNYNDMLDDDTIIS